MNTDILVAFAIDCERRRDLDIGISKIRQLLFPIGAFKFKEQGAQRIRVVKGRVCNGLHVRGRNLLARLGRSLFATSPWPAGRAKLALTAAIGTLLFQEFAGGLSFGSIESAI